MKPSHQHLIGDAGHIAAELLQGVAAIELTCKAIERTVTRGVYSLEEALEVYEVSKEDYQAQNNKAG